MIEFNHVGYFKKKIFIKKWPTKPIYKIKYLIKFILLNLIKPFKNSLIHIEKKWIIIDCNMTLKNGTVYRLIGDKKLKKIFLKILNKYNKGSIKGISNYKIINYRDITNTIKRNHLIIIDSNNIQINKNILNKNIFLITSKDFELDSSIQSKRIELNFNRILLC